MMNFAKATLATAVLAAFATQPAQAIESETRQDLTAITTIAVATAAAGPVGFVLGSVGASWLASQVGDAGELPQAQAALDKTRAELDTTQSELLVVRGQLDATREEQARFARLALEQLQLEMLFRSNDSRLTSAGEERLALLAMFLKRHADLTVHIAGYADPRGDADSNLALSRARAERVAEQLTAAGVTPARLEVLAFGEQHSIASEGDMDAYALERRVHISLQQGSTARRVAEVTLVGN